MNPLSVFSVFSVVEKKTTDGTDDTDNFKRRTICVICVISGCLYLDSFQERDVAACGAQDYRLTTFNMHWDHLY